MIKKNINIKNIIAWLILAVLTFGWILAPNNPSEHNLLLRLTSPSFSYPLGTDSLGRCIFSRFLYGGQTTLLLVISVGIAILLLGTIIGLFLGWYKGRFTPITDGVIYLFTAFPAIIFVVTFVGNWGTGISAFVVALVFSGFAMVAKLVKTLVEDEKEKAYIFCAIASGASRSRLLVHHILPNIIKSVLEYTSMCCADMILLTVGFSYVGISMGPDVIHWGDLLMDAQSLLSSRPEYIWLISAGIFLSTLSLNMLSENLERK